MKTYDRDYFDHWYRSPGAPKDEAVMRRQLALSVAAAESVLNRPLVSVLDVGCGEGRWQPVLRELRPDASYLGIDPSQYAVERFGEERNLMRGSLQDLPGFAFPEPFDLVVCADVLHYLDKEAVIQGMEELAELVGGVALLEVFTADDPVEGDLEGFHARPARWYRKVFEGAGLLPLGLQLYVHAEIAEVLDDLDLSGAHVRPVPSGRTLETGS